MCKTIKKITSVILAVVMLSAVISVNITVNAAEAEQVRVIVRNDVYSIENGAPWEGILLDEWVDIDDDSTMMSSVISALDSNGYTQTGAEYDYITEINGLSAGDSSAYGGWMGTLNDWFTSSGCGDYTVANGNLESGDEICIMYSDAWGADIGSDWSSNDTSLADIAFSTGTLSQSFDSEITDYTLTVPNDTTEIVVTATAQNKNFQVRTYKNEYTPSEKGYKRSAEIPVSDGDKIIVGIGDESWPSMNYSEGASVYTFAIELEEPSPISKDVTEKLASTSEYLSSLSTPTVSSVGGEWLVLGLARNESISDSFAQGYYENVVSYVESKGSSKLDSSKSTENSRVILGLTSIGKDVTDIGGYNLLEPLADFDFIKKQGLNGPVWALIALDSLNYEIPVDESVTTQTTRESLISYILDSQLENGGWTFFGSSADPDMTGMAITALAPYYTTNEDVAKAIDLALQKISEIQQDNGGFSSWSSVNPESCAQIIVALTSLGINPETDSRFIKNGNSAIDALMSFGVENGFQHIAGGAYNQMATEQAYYALVVYSRIANGKTSLYDMTDLIIAEPEIPMDVNQDGVLTIDDATVIQKFIAELVKLTDEQIKLADINGDGEVSVDDATYIQKVLAEIDV